MMYDVTRPCLINISTADSGLSCNSQIQIKYFSTEEGGGGSGRDSYLDILLELQSFNFFSPSVERLGEFTLLLVRQLTIKLSDPASVWLIRPRCHVWQVLFSVNWVIALLLQPLQVLIRLFIPSWLEISCSLKESRDRCWLRLVAR